MLFRRRLTALCGKFASVEEWHDHLAQHLQPILSEFDDVLPAAIHQRLQQAATVTQPTREGLSTCCDALKGEVDAVARDLAAHLGLEGRVRELLRPLADLAPAWLAESALAKAAVAAAIALLGGGVTAAVIVVAMGDGGAGDEARQPRVTTPTSAAGQGTPTVAPSPTTEPSFTAGGLTPVGIDPCILLTKSEVEAELGQPIEEPRRLADQPTCVYEEITEPPPEGIVVTPPGVGMNLYFYTTGGAQDFDRFKNEPSLAATPVPGIGDDAFWTTGALYVLKGDFYFALVMYVSGSDETNRERAQNLAKIALGRLPPDLAAP